MSVQERPFTSIVLGAMVILGAIVSLSSGMTYLHDDDVSGITAGLLSVAGILMLIGGLGCFIGRRAVLWKILFSSLIVEAIAGAAMIVDLTIAGGALLIVICAIFIWIINWTTIRDWFGV